MVRFRGLSRPSWSRQTCPPGGSSASSAGSSRLPLAERTLGELNSDLNQRHEKGFLKTLRRPFMKQTHPLEPAMENSTFGTSAVAPTVTNSCGNTRNTAFREKGQLPSEVSASIFPKGKLEDARFRTVVFRVPPDIHINTMVAGLTGGPLERVVEHSDPNRNFRQVDVTFLNPSDAKLFHNYANSGRFVANSRVMFPLTELHSPPPGYGRCLYWRHYDPDTAKGAHCTAYRCLQLIRRDDKAAFQLHGPTDQYGKYTRPTVSLPESIDGIREAFSWFGRVLDITPFVTYRACFIIHFADIRSAVEAKINFDTGGFLRERFQSWDMVFTRDPVDSPCEFVGSL